MRTIKFRGKTTYDFRWKYGSLLHINGYYHIIEQQDMEEDGHHVRQISDRPTWVEFYEQFTGEECYDGTEIYEGDILDVTVFDCFGGDTQHIVTVEWCGSGFYGMETEDIGWELYWLLQQDCEARVIGNIHDNPELLKEK